VTKKPVSLPGSATKGDLPDRPQNLLKSSRSLKSPVPRKEVFPAIKRGNAIKGETGCGLEKRGANGPRFGWGGPRGGKKAKGKFCSQSGKGNGGLVPH